MARIIRNFKCKNSNTDAPIDIMLSGMHAFGIQLPAKSWRCSLGVFFVCSSTMKFAVL